MIWRRMDPDGYSGIRLRDEHGEILVTVWTGSERQVLKLSREDAESLARAVAEWAANPRRS